MSEVSRVWVTGFIAATFALSVFHTMGPTVHLQLYATLLLLAALTPTVLAVIRRRELVWSPAHSIATCYVCWLVLLVYTSTLSGNTLLFFWLLASLPVVMLVGCELEEHDLRRLFLFGLPAGIVTATWGIAEFVVTGYRANGPLIDPNLWCAVNNLLFFGVLALYLSSERHRAVYLPLLILFSAASLTAYSRVGTVVFGVASVFVLVVLATEYRLRQRLLLATGMVLTSFTLVYGSAGLTEATAHTEGYTLDTNVQGWSQRLSMWRAAWEMYKEHPVAGIGPGTYKLHYPRFRDGDDVTNSGNFAHNDYLQFLTEGGPPLLLILLVFAGWLLWLLLRQVLNRERTNGQVRVLVLVVAMGTPLVHGLMNFPLYNLSVQMLLGIYLVLVLRELGVLKSRQIALTRTRLVRAGALFTLFYAGAVVTVEGVANDLIYDYEKLPFIGYFKQDEARYHNTIEMLRTVRPQHPGGHFAMATLYRMGSDAHPDQEGKYALALASALSYQQGLSLNPYNFKVRGYFADLLQQFPTLQTEPLIDASPLSLLQENLRLAPVYVEHHLAIADYLTSVGGSDDAYRLLLEEALPWADVRHADYQDYRLRLYVRVFRESVSRDDHAGLRRLLQKMDSEH